MEFFSHFVDPEHKLRIGRDSKGNKAYHGQVLLYPPDINVADIDVADIDVADIDVADIDVADIDVADSVVTQQFSTGLVAVKNANDPSWRAIGINEPLSEVEADTICRSMGYTQVVPNSVMTKEEAWHIFNFTFTIPEEYMYV